MWNLLKLVQVIRLSGLKASLSYKFIQFNSATFLCLSSVHNQDPDFTIGIYVMIFFCVQWFEMRVSC